LGNIFHVRVCIHFFWAALYFVKHDDEISTSGIHIIISLLEPAS